MIKKTFLSSIIACCATVIVCNATEILFWKNLIKQNSLVFDVGANRGDKTDIFLQCGASVIAFEPQENCLTILKQRFSNNPFVSIESIGLAAQPGQLTFFEANTDTISTFSQEWVQEGRFSTQGIHANQGHKWKEKHQVAVDTLDNMIKKYGVPDFIKIDVEGFEYDVLKGLNTLIPCLNFEFSIELMESAKKCLNHLESIGYTQFNFGKGNHDQFLLTNWVSKDELINILKHENQTTYGLWGDIYAR